MKLQTILFPNEQICDEEALYLHKEEGFILFDGFFNLFYLEKHHKYCDLDGLSLELCIHGIKNIVLMHDRDVIREVDCTDAVVSGLDRLKGKTNPVDEDRRISIELPYHEYQKGVFWFKAEPVGIDADWNVSGHFEGKTKAWESNSAVESITTGKQNVSTSPVPAEKKQKNIEIAVNICTYKREPYVIRNMRSLMTWLSGKDIDGKKTEAAEHMHIFIVDNGQTLSDNVEFRCILNELYKSTSESSRELTNESQDIKNTKDTKSDSLITVIPNANTGGTGGFSRGMLEAIERKDVLDLTHLLMMDDDAVFDSDLFIRLYGFLSTLKEEFAGITVGGALMREDYRYIQHAAGEWYEALKVHNDHLLVDLRDYDVCTSDWMTGTESEHPLYGAWWCCCYNMDAITKENIPLPIFVHHDDIQFGLKQKERGIVFLNGICVWHQGFELVFPGVKQYYNMRNILITAYISELNYLKKHMKWWAIKRYIGMFISYRYGDCELVYRGVMDFLKGKQWLLTTDPEQLHKELMDTYNRICPKLPYNQIKSYVNDIKTDISTEELRSYYTWDRFIGSKRKILSINGWFLPADNELKVLTPLDSPWDTYRHKQILLYEPATKKGYIMKRDNAELFKGMYRIVKMAISIDLWMFSGSKW